MDIRTLSGILDKAPGVRVLCIGDVMLDRFVYGSTHRVSREAPVPVLDERSIEQMLGGAGNVIRNVRAIGAQARLISVVGEDGEAEDLRTALDDAGASHDLVSDAAHTTPVKTRFVANGDQMLCVDRNPKGGLSADTETRLLGAIETALGETDIVVLSDYGRGVVSPAVSQGLMTMAAARGIRVCVDPRGKDFSRYNGAFLIKPNALELCEECDIDPVDDAACETALGTVYTRLNNVSHLIVTRGSRGMSVTDGKSVDHVRTRPRQVYDVSGAGDTAISMLAIALGAGSDLRDAMEAAVHASGEVVTKVGTATVTPHDLIAASGGDKADGAVGLAELVEAVARWRAHGLKIGLTNGCFDILHAGHVRYLQQARAGCDRLIVGLNSDASVRRLKGEGRPVNDSGVRAEVLSALGAVDQVVVFDEDTPVNLIETLRPEVYFKGADYSLEDLRPLGGSVVESYGGEICLIPLVKGQSTTTIINRISN